MPVWLQEDSMAIICFPKCDSHSLDLKFWDKCLWPNKSLVVLLYSYKGILLKSTPHQCQTCQHSLEWGGTFTLKKSHTQSSIKESLQGFFAVTPKGISTHIFQHYGKRKYTFENIRKFFHSSFFSFCPQGILWSWAGYRNSKNSYLH